LDHKNYIMKVFFPGVSDHPILNDPKVRRWQIKPLYFCLVFFFFFI
jgi:plexin A